MNECCVTKPYCKGFCKKHYNADYFSRNREKLAVYQRAYSKSKAPSTCEECSGTKQIHGKGLCSACYRRTYRKRRGGAAYTTKFTNKWRAANPEKYRVYSRHYSSFRRANKISATPAWVDLAALRDIYDKCPPGHHVDHIIPLKGKNVCGLHVPHNLQYLPALENIKKGNKF